MLFLVLFLISHLQNSVLASPICEKQVNVHFTSNFQRNSTHCIQSPYDMDILCILKMRKWVFYNGFKNEATNYCRLRDDRN